MSYYRGDGGGNFYRGDYYRGDPFLGGLVAGAAGKLIGRAGAALGRAVGRARRSAGPIMQEMAPSAAAGAVGVALGRRGMPTLGPIGGGDPATAKQKRAWERSVGIYRPSRRINPLNPKALRRALRRAEGFEKFAARTINGLYKVVDGRRVRTYKKKTRS